MLPRVPPVPWVFHGCLMDDVAALYHAFVRLIKSCIVSTCDRVIGSLDFAYQTSRTHATTCSATQYSG